MIANLGGPSTAFLVDIAVAALLGAGTTLILSTMPWFRHSDLMTRISPYLPDRGRGIESRRTQIGLRETLEPTLEQLGRRLNRALGIVTDLPVRLRRAGIVMDPYDFRLRQMLFGLISVIVATVVWVATPISTVLGLVVLVGAPIGTVLGMEQWLDRRIGQRTTRLVAELPVVIEQLGMLVSAGFSLTSGVAHIAGRGSGVVADDFRAVTREIRHGTPPSEAFDSWATISGTSAVERVVAVLALNSEASDLGALISMEARSIRASTHRGLLETIEKRSQLVWIPVTVATLVPGLIFLAVPFYAAMSRVTGG